MHPGRVGLLLMVVVGLEVGALPTGARAKGRCGVERWAVKTGTDREAGGVDLGRRTPTTIEFLTAQSRPSSPPPDSRLGPVETTQWTIDATLVEDKAENDSDYHLVIADGGGRTMIAELGDPGCVASSSPFRAAIERVRAHFEARYLPSAAFAAVNVPVRITGVGFFDFRHGQAGVAPNAVELHPVTDIVFFPQASAPGIPPGTEAGPTNDPGLTPPSSTASPVVAAGGDLRWVALAVSILLVVAFVGLRRRRSGR